MGGVHPQDVFRDAVGGGVSGEVEVGVVGEVDDGGSVCRGLIGNVNGIVLREGEGNAGFHRSGEAAVPVRGFEGEFEMGFTGLLHFKELVLPAFGAAVQAVPKVILRKLVGGSVQGKAALGYAVGVSAYCGAKVRLVVFRVIVFHAVEAQHHILRVPFPVRHQDGDYPAPVGRNGHLHAGGVGKGVNTGLRFLCGAGGQQQRKSQKKRESVHNTQRYGKSRKLPTPDREIMLACRRARTPAIPSAQSRYCARRDGALPRDV